MEVEFGNRQLQRCYESRREATRRWGHSVGAKYIEWVGLIIETPDFQDLFAFRFLRLHRLRGDRKGSYAMTLHGRWRLIADYDETNDVIVIREVSNHYDD